MLIHGLRQLVALVLTVTLLVGCHHWVPIRVEALAQDSVPTVRLTLWDESNVTVEQPTLVGDSIYGAYPGGDGAIKGAAALKNVRTVEVWELDKMKTAQWVVAGLLWGLMPLNY